MREQAIITILNHGKDVGWILLSSLADISLTMLLVENVLMGTGRGITRLVLIVFPSKQNR